MELSDDDVMFWIGVALALFFTAAITALIAMG